MDRGVSVPHHWLGMVLVVIFPVQLNLLPAMGAGPGGSADWAWDWEHIRHLIPPAVTLCVIPMGIVTRTVRGTAAAELAAQARQAALHRSEGYWAGVWKRLRRDPVTILFATGFASHDPYQFVPPVIRVAESVTTGVRNLDFVDAARASGASAFTIVRVHVLGNVLGPIFVYATSLIGVRMILASGLSFLGLGTRPPEPAWGLMLNTLRTAIHVQPWVAVLPGACIFVTSICFNLVSDGLRQAMDVKG